MASDMTLSDIYERKTVSELSCDMEGHNQKFFGMFFAFAIDTADAVMKLPVGPIPLLSLDKTKSVEELVSFAGEHQILLMLKLDRRIQKAHGAGSQVPSVLVTLTAAVRQGLTGGSFSAGGDRRMRGIQGKPAQPFLYRGDGADARLPDTGQQAEHDHPPCGGKSGPWPDEFLQSGL